MKTIKLKLYSFDELSEQAQNKALNDLRTINVDFNWWESTYEDAKNIGLKITGFDLDRNKHATGQFTLSALEVAQNILNDHGDECQTYKLATEFLSKHNPIFADYMDENSENYESRDLEGQLQDLEQDFLNDLLKDYADMLQKECEHLMSREAIIETFEANDYTFEENGRLNNTQPEQEQILETAWDFVEKYYPNYDSSDLIARSNDLAVICEDCQNLQEGSCAKKLFEDELGSSLTEAEQEQYIVNCKIYEQAIENFINTQK
jgi:hypothetical protein